MRTVVCPQIIMASKSRKSLPEGERGSRKLPPQPVVFGVDILPRHRGDFLPRMQKSRWFRGADTKRYFSLLLLKLLANIALPTYCFHTALLIDANTEYQVLCFYSS